ncbi:MAG: hypothetical protein GZ088_09760 [Acidipila sp.]|nr:hypothetical protein [Acidipila sp.]
MNMMGMAGKNSAHALLGLRPQFRHRMHGLNAIDLSTLAKMLPTGAVNAANTAVQAAGYAQTPQFSQQVDKVTGDVETYLFAQIGLQTMATVATFGIFLIALHKFMRNK